MHRILLVLRPSASFFCCVAQASSSQCSRLHYVTHRLALGEEGLEDMIAAEKKIVGHSIFANTSSLAVLAMPVMDFEEGAQANGTANQLVQNDPTVRKHLQVCTC